MEAPVLVMYQVLETQWEVFFQNCLRTILIKKKKKPPRIVFITSLLFGQRMDLPHFFDVFIPPIWLWITSSNF